MDIKSINSNITINKYINNVRSVENKKIIKEVNKIDKIEISSFSKNMVSMSQTENSSRELKKIQKIMNSLENGTYKINPEEIAKKMLEDMRG